MPLISLRLRDFRCFEQVHIELGAETSLFVGSNASGKTSLIEAIFFLSRLRSFRSGRSDALIRTGAAEFQIVGKVVRQTGLNETLGVGRGPRGTEVHIGGRPAESAAELSAALPVQLLDAHAHLLIEGGPRHRRQFLDWGVFHVEPGFYGVWRRYRRCLQQRNAALRRGVGSRELAGWDEELVAGAGALDGYRQGYVESLQRGVEHFGREVLGLGRAVTLRYRRGWPEGVDFRTALQQSGARERVLGATQVGPHRADADILLEGRRVQDQVSRGQQKALASALLIAQAALLAERRGVRATLLIDDLAAELDRSHRERVVGVLQEIPAQRIYTAVEERSLAIPGGAPQLFHVERNEVRAMV